MPIPAAAPGDAPLLCLAVNAEWMQYVLGALKQLMLPATWGDAADPLVQGAQRAANDLIALFAEASACGAGSVAGLFAQNCLAAPVPLPQDVLTTLLTVDVVPGDYQLIARANVGGVDAASGVALSLWDGDTAIAADNSYPAHQGWNNGVTLDAHVSPLVDTTYTLKALASYQHAMINSDTVDTPTGANVATCLTAYPQGVSGPTGADGAPGPATQMRFTAGCGLEYSTDGGVTWLAVPGWLANAPSCFAGFAGAGIPASSIDPGVPFTPDGVSVDQEGCNIAAYLANDIIKASLNQAITSIEGTEAALQFATALFGILPFVDLAFVPALEGVSLFYLAINAGTLSDYTAANGDATLWSLVQCAIYAAIRVDGHVDAANFATAETNIRAIAYVHADVITTIADYWHNLGLKSIEHLQAIGGLAVGDCSSCAAGGCTAMDFATGAHGWGPYPSDTGAVYDASAGHWFGTDPGVHFFVCDIVNTAIPTMTLTGVEIIGVMGASNQGFGIEISQEDLSDTHDWGAAIPPGPFDITIPLAGLTWNSLRVSISSVNNSGLAMTISKIKWHFTGSPVLSGDFSACS